MLTEEEKSCIIRINTTGLRVEEDDSTTYKVEPNYLTKILAHQALEEKDVLQLGKHLYDIVFSTPGRKKLLKDKLASLSPGEFITFHIVSPLDEIRNLPFELMNPTGDMNDFLIRNGKLAVIRISPPTE